MANYDVAVTAAMTGKITTPACIPYTDQASVDPAIRSPKTAGRVQTRARFTALPRAYHIVYRAITTHDKNLIDEFEKTVKGGADSFTWSRPTGGGATTFRFVGLAMYRPWEETNYKYWTVEFDVESTTGDL